MPVSPSHSSRVSHECSTKDGSSTRALSWRPSGAVLTSRQLAFLIAFCSISISATTILIAYRYSLFSSLKVSSTSFWDGVYRPLAQQPFYLEHFTSPPIVTAGASKEAIEQLRSLVSKALAVRTNGLDHVRPQKGLTFTASFANHDYQKAKSLLNPLCEPSLVHVPKASPNLSPMCLSVFENSYVGPSGAVYDPNTNRIHDMGGGCFLADWVRYTDHTISLRMSPTRLPVVLAMGFHHDVSYHHVIYELLPRLLPIFPLLGAEPHIYIAIDESAVTMRLLSVFGIDASRVIPIKLSKAIWVHGAIVLQPPPYFLCRKHWNCMYNNTVITANVMRDAVLGKDDSEQELKERATLLLMERARSRKKDGSCKEQRCVKNFAQLQNAIRKEYGDEFDITVVPPEMSVIDTIKTFSAADVIVGLHGAGFQNMIYCSKGTTVVHIGWGRHYEDLATEFGLKYHLSKMASLTRGKRNVVVNVSKIIADIKNAINKDRTTLKGQLRRKAN